MERGTKITVLRKFNYYIRYGRYNLRFFYENIEYWIIYIYINSVSDWFRCADLKEEVNSDSSKYCNADCGARGPTLLQETMDENGTRRIYEVNENIFRWIRNTA